MKNIGFIGVGIMGKSMVRNLMKANYTVHIYARTKEKVADVIAEGALFHDSIKACVHPCGAVITMVGYPADVEEVYYGTEGILANVRTGSYVIDMTTSSPKLATDLYTKAKELGIKALDAPVTGGDVGAKNGTLSILVGGDQDDFTMCEPIFQALGTTITYEGGAGCGQHTKMANQIMIAGTLSGLCEALNYAKAKGLDMQTFLDSVSTGAAGSKQLDALAPRILSGDFNPGFFIKHFIKDMNLANEEALESGLDLSVLALALKHYKEMAANGQEELGTHALFHYYNPKQSQ